MSKNNLIRYNNTNKMTSNKTGDEGMYTNYIKLN